MASCLISGDRDTLNSAGGWLTDIPHLFVINTKANFDYDLIVLYGTIFYVPADLIDFEPIQVSHRFRGSPYRGLDCFRNRHFRAAYKFHLLINVVAHSISPFSFVVARVRWALPAAIQVPSW